MKSALGFAVLVVLIIGALLIFPGRKWPSLPDDAAHRAASTVDACKQCHAPGKAWPLKPSHPPKFSCFKCHKAKNKE
ncbi:MAG: hypothetical protein M0Z48_03620 [Nitrospiraceae bacterium]|nr:hypothetical protein [Nitrospiraceae bacterium]